jgi:hypothetical protein
MKKPIEKRYWGVDGEYHIGPIPGAKHQNFRPSGYVQPATAEDAKELNDAIKECEEAERKQKEK